MNWEGNNASYLQLPNGDKTQQWNKPPQMIQQTLDSTTDVGEKATSESTAT